MNAQQLESGVAALYRTGHHLLTHGDPQRAAAIFRAMITVAPGDERGWLGLGVCHEHVEQLDVAIDIYRSASFVLARGARCELAAHRLLLRSGDDDGAEFMLSQAREHADEELLEMIDEEVGGA
jgi:Flp pilus assembly protein TadD